MIASLPHSLALIAVMGAAIAAVSDFPRLRRWLRRRCTADGRRLARRLDAYRRHD